MAVGQTVELDVTLKVSTLDETITVTGRRAGRQRRRPREVSTNYNREWVQNAPVRRFSYFDLINSAPGVSATSNVGQSTSAQSLGSSTNENPYQIDGTDISSTPWLNTDAIEEVRGAAARRLGRVRQRPGRRLQHRHPPGQQRVPRRRELYFQNDALTGRNTTDARRHGLPVPPRRVGRTRRCRRRARSSRTSSGSSARCSISATGTRSRAWTRRLRRRTTRAGCSGSSTTTSRQNHRLMHGYHDDYYCIPGIADRVHRAEHDQPEPRRQPDAEPGLHRRPHRQDVHRSALLGVLLHGSHRSRSGRAAARPDALRGPGHRPHHRRHHATGTRTAAGGKGTRRRCRTTSTTSSAAATT